jgi:hypothetical protein
MTGGGRSGGAKAIGLERKVAIGATAAVLGIAVVGTRASELGAALVVAGLAYFMWQIHRYGRLGPDRRPP